MHTFTHYKKHYQALLKLGIPIVIGQIGMIVLSFADTLMIGRYSTNGLAAAAFVNNMFNLAIIFGTGFSYGLIPVVGGLYGNKRFPEAGQALRNSLLANLVIALLLTFVMCILYLNVGNLGQPEELLPLIRPYFLILLSSLLFVMLFNGFKQFTDGITQTKVSMWILLGTNLLNIVGNYLLIYGKGGFPELGLIGAGISTLFSRVVAVILYLIIFSLFSPLCRISDRVSPSGLVRSVVSPVQRAGMAHWPTDGYGGCFLQPEYHYDRLAGSGCPGFSPGHAHDLYLHFHDVLWHGSCCSRTGQ